MKPKLRNLLVLALASPAIAQPQSVVGGPHNLSAGGPGTVKATSEDQVCIFCHAPHNASPIRPLWNRAMPADGYAIYASRALDAQPGQPTGASKMCLSCHDGTIALGAVISRDTPIDMQGGVTTLPAGPSRLGTDLRDDHPISFRFDQALAGRDAKLKSPTALPSAIHLDGAGELQCTSCHDAHNNQYTKFLVMRNENSQLCQSCHQMGQTTVSAHTDCASCHQPHSAPSGPYLLRKVTITDTCNACHNGTVSGAANIASEITKVSNHDTHPAVDPSGSIADSATCTDCHEPHTITSGTRTLPAASPRLGKVSGVSASGAPLAQATNEFEVCFKCHADTSTRTPIVSRVIAQTNTRLEFSPSAVSYHPVETAGRNTFVPSLKPGWTTSSIVGCSSCHGSDVAVGGIAGVHGSGSTPVLRARYETRDFTTESAQAYALCYLCHDRTNILDDRSFKEHKKHIVEERTPCSVCHDSHGISGTQGNATNNTNLINFQSGIVTGANTTGRLEFRDTGLRTGTCYLKCHGENHGPKSYGP